MGAYTQFNYKYIQIKLRIWNFSYNHAAELANDELAANLERQLKLGWHNEKAISFQIRLKAL